MQQDGISIDEKKLVRKFHNLDQINSFDSFKGDAVGITFPAERTLRWLIDQPNKQASSVPEEVVPKTDQLNVYYELVNASLVQKSLDIDSNFSFLLTPQGIVEANRLKNSYRYSLAQRRVLDWLLKHPKFSPEEFIKTPFAQDFTGYLTQNEIEQAVDELDEKGFIDTRRAFGNFILFARLTSSGHQLHRQNMSIDQMNSNRGSSTMNISANNYGQQTVGSQTFGGEGHIVNTNFSSDNGSLDINDLLKKFQEIIENSDASTEDKQDLADEVARVEKNTEKRGLKWAHKALESVVEAALPILGQEGASALMALIPKY